jgi:hypothetical protein
MIINIQKISIKSTLKIKEFKESFERFIRIIRIIK